MFFVYLFNDSSKYTIHSGNSTEENQVRLAESSLPHEALEGPLQVAERKIVTKSCSAMNPMYNTTDRPDKMCTLAQQPVILLSKPLS